MFIRRVSVDRCRRRLAMQEIRTFACSIRIRDKTKIFTSVCVCVSSPLPTHYIVGSFPENHHVNGFRIVYRKRSPAVRATLACLFVGCNAMHSMPFISFHFIHSVSNSSSRRTISNGPSTNRGLGVPVWVYRDKIRPTYRISLGSSTVPGTGWPRRVAVKSASIRR